MTLLIKIKHLSTLLIVPFLLSSQISHAATYESGAKNITSLRFGDTGISIQFNPAPSNCNGGTQYRMHAHLHKDHPNYDALASGLLALKTTDTPIQILFLSNENITCSAAQILSLDAFEY